MKKIFIGSDHRGFYLKEKIKNYLKNKYKVIDVGNFNYDPLDDYPDFAKNLVKNILKEKNSYGILICGTGVGMTIAANRKKGIFCGLVFNKDQAQRAKKEDNINVISLPADFLTFKKAKEIIDVFLKTKFSRKRKYTQRLKKIDLF